MGSRVSANKGKIVGGIATYFTGNPAFLAAGASYDAGEQSQKQAEIDMQLQRDDERTAARDREISKRDKLLHILAMQEVGTAVSGTTMSGSNRNLLNQSFRNYEQDTLRENAMSSIRDRNHAVRVASSRRATKINQASSLINTVYTHRQTG